jgi:hypothetical protein
MLVLLLMLIIGDGKIVTINQWVRFLGEKSN